MTDSLFMMPNNVQTRWANPESRRNDIEMEGSAS